MRRGSTERGFTLVEVMLALAILVGGLVILLRGTAQNIQTSQRSEMLGIATDLARGKMYDVEEKLLHDGFGELDLEEEGDFDEEGWPEYKWTYTVEKVELPNAGALGAIQGEGEDGEGGASTGAGDPLGGLLGMGGGDSGALGGASFITGQFEMIRQVLEAAIRKVTITIEWKALVSDEQLVVVCFFTDPAAISRVLGGLPAAGTSGDGGDSGGDSGGGSGVGGSGSGGTSGGSSKR
jgi:general secretion pathway protein I